MGAEVRALDQPREQGSEMHGFLDPKGSGKGLVAAKRDQGPASLLLVGGLLRQAG